MSKTVVVVSGGFDPLHSGHIAYFEAAKKLGDVLVIGVNSDAWLSRKKGKAFMPITERLAVVGAIYCVDYVWEFDDSDDTALDLIAMVKQQFTTDRIIFANGGDRTSKNIPEMAAQGVEFVFGVGGTEKINSSSWLLDNWTADGS